jgi:hypothetical protein
MKIPSFRFLLPLAADLRKTEIVFKDGVGFDSKKLFDAVKGLVGIQ